MAFNGSGVFNRIYNWVNDRNANIPITAQRVDTEDDGFAAGLSNCVTRDGQSPATANLPMGGFHHTNVSDATQINQYATLNQIANGGIGLATVTGTGDAILLTTTPATAAYTAGQKISFVVTTVNTGPVTVNLNGNGVKSITKNGTVPLVAGDLNVGRLIDLEYDGTQFQTTLFAERDWRGKNRIINGSFDLWQRGTSFAAASNIYTADRWVFVQGVGGTAAIARIAFTIGQTDVPGDPTYFLRHTQSVLATTAPQVIQRIEGVRTFAGQTCVLGMWAKADTPRTVTPTLRQNFGTGGGPSADVSTVGTAMSLTTAWQYFKTTFTLPSIAGKTLGTNGNDALFLLLDGPTGATYALDYSQVQLEPGVVGTPFEYRFKSEITALCQRYYFKTFAQSVTPAQAAVDGNNALNFVLPVGASTAFSGVCMPLPVLMRAAPTVIGYNPDAANAQIRNLSIGQDLSATTIVGGERSIYLSATSNAGGAVGNRCYVHITADAEL